MNLVIVQARLGSSRLPNKVLLNIGKNSTILDLIIKRIKQSKKVDRIIIATTDQEADLPLVDYCKSKGYRVFKGSENDCLDRHYRCALSVGAKCVSKIPSDVEI